jgi:sirohydrochlorin cobaltochelatase
MSGRGIVLFAHGARDPEWAAPLQRLAGIVADLDASAEVAVAFLEFIQPPLEQAVANMLDKGIDDVTVVPVFIAQGGHLKQDLPLIVAAIRAANPGLSIRLAAPIGESEAVLQAIAAFASAASRATA